jgi:hypothetical protein
MCQNGMINEVILHRVVVAIGEVHLHHKFIGFMGLFQICAKSIISWVRIS